MKRYNYFAVIWMIAAAAYLLLAFTYSRTPYSEVMWISIGFTLVSYGLAFFLMYLVFGKTLSFTKRFLGLPLHLIGVVYAAIQTVASFVFLFSSFSPRSAFVFQVILLGCCLLIILSTQFVRSHVEHIDWEIEQKRSYLRDLERRVGLLLPIIQDPEIKKYVKTIYDKLKYANPMSPRRAAALESDVSEKIELLEKMAGSDERTKTLELCLKIMRLLDERQSLCRK